MRVQLGGELQVLDGLPGNVPGQFGERGDSGRGSEPHLHYHLQGSPEYGLGEGMPARFLRYLADGVPVECGEPVRGAGRGADGSRVGLRSQERQRDDTYAVLTRVREARRDDHHQACRRLAVYQLR